MSKTFTETDLAALAALARITIKDSEKEKMLLDMQAILGYISEINELVVADTQEEGVLVNVVREDVAVEKSINEREVIVRNAPHTKNGYIEVTQVL